MQLAFKTFKVLNIKITCASLVYARYMFWPTFIAATHNTTGETTHHHRAHGRIDEGIPQKLKLQMETQQFH
jgi:hypothetical protein